MSRRRAWDRIDQLICILSGEWMLDSRPNGGTIIALRSFQVAALLFIASLLLLEATDPARIWFTFDPNRMWNLVHENLAWLGALLAVTYTAFYARFSAQWTYLADLYNQIQATMIPLKDGDFHRPSYVIWVAGFIEDAVTLHLARKPMFAECILEMLKIEGVRNCIDESAFALGSDQIEEHVRASLNVRAHA